MCGRSGDDTVGSWSHQVEMTLECAGSHFSCESSHPFFSLPSTSCSLASSSSRAWTAAGATWEASGMADGYHSQDRASCCPSDSSQNWSGSRELTKRMQGCCYEFRLFQSGKKLKEGSSMLQIRKG